MKMISDSEVKLGTYVYGDAFYLFEAVQCSRENMTNLKWVRDATRLSIQTHISNPSPGEILRIILNNGVPVGVATLRPHKDDYMVGYWIDNRVQGRGIATEAVRQLLRLSDRNVIANIRVENKRSQKVVVRAGFKLIGWDGVHVNYRWELHHD